MNNDWFHEYFINELKAIGRKSTSNMQYEVVDSLPSSGNEQTIYFVKNDSSSTNDYYDEYAWLSSSSAFEKIGSTQIDGSTTQPDWNQNDDTQPNYIKNRPFYTGDPVETVLVEESTVSFTDTGEGFYATQFQSTFEATSGETYKVCWDGTIYERTCVIINDVPIIGNLSIMGIGSDTGEPFLMAVENGSGIMIYAAGTASSHTFSISAIVQEVVKIDPKYIRDMYYTADPVETVFVEESAVSFEYDLGVYIGQLESIFSATVGETYKVSWDGSVYESTCLEFSKALAIGNLSIMGEGSDTGEPFLIAIRNVGRIDIATQNTSASHTISISGIVQEVVKIDEKYLPDTVATKSDVESTANDAVKYTSSQNLTDAQKRQARTNIGAGTSSFSGNWSDLTNKPIKPTGESYLTFRSTNSFTLEVKSKTKPWDGTLEYFASDGTWTTWDGKSVLSAIDYYSEYVLCLRGIGNTFISGRLDVKWILTGADIKCIGNIENLLDYATVKSGVHPTLADSCYQYMFANCTSLTQAPELPATTLANYCYSNMFQGCTSLIQAPVLPATTLTNSCYSNMFNGCTSLTKVPVLPAITLAIRCYTNMFQGCTGLKLSITPTNEYAQEYRIPSSGDGTAATAALHNMFISTGGTFAGEPSINTTYYLSTDNMIVRETEIATLNGYVGSMIDAALSKIGVAEEGAY